jgi:hypothetical protein
MGGLRREDWGSAARPQSERLVDALFFQHKRLEFCLLQHAPGRAFSRRIGKPERWCIVRISSPVRMALKHGLGAGAYR